MTDKALAEIYAVSVVTVRRWRRAGRDASLPAPLTAPEKMPDWWATMQSTGALEWDCPQGVLQAAKKVSAAMAQDAPQEVQAGPDAELSILLADIEAGKGLDYRSGIKVAERNVQVTDFLLLRALKAGDEKKVGPLQRRLNDAQDTLRALQRDRGKIEMEARDVLPKEEVRAALVEIHSNITKRFRQGIRAGFHDAAELTTDRESWGEWTDKLVDDICRSMRESNFAAP